MNITENTMLKDILEKNPSIKEKLMEYNPEFKLLDTALSKVMIPKATIKMMSERGNVPVEDLIKKIKEWL